MLDMVGVDSCKKEILKFSNQNREEKNMVKKWQQVDLYYLYIWMINSSLCEDRNCAETSASVILCLSIVVKSKKGRKQEQNKEKGTSSL